MTQKQIIESTISYIKNLTYNESTGHDWWHIKRVYSTALSINEIEQADSFIIAMIALLHDLYDHKFFDGNTEESLKQTLKDLKVYESIPENSIKNIIYNTANLGFSANFNEKKQLSKEGKIVQDADRLDAIGAIGIARTFAYGEKKNIPIFNEKLETVDEKTYKEKGSNTSINHFYDKLLKIEELMNTNTGKIIAKQRTKVLKEYLEEFYIEWYGKDLKIEPNTVTKKLSEKEKDREEI